MFITERDHKFQFQLAHTGEARLTDWLLRLIQLMFVTQSHLELPFPRNFSEDTTHHWRSIGLSAQAPWYLVTFRVGSADEGICETIGVGSDQELISLIDQNCEFKVVDLMCVMPAWQTGAERWTSRSVSSVWRVRRGALDALIFLDTAGQEFTCGPKASIRDKNARTSLIATVWPLMEP